MALKVLTIEINLTTNDVYFSALFKYFNNASTKWVISWCLETKTIQTLVLDVFVVWSLRPRTVEKLIERILLLFIHATNCHPIGKYPEIRLPLLHATIFGSHTESRAFWFRPVVSSWNEPMDEHKFGCPLKESAHIQCEYVVNAFKIHRTSLFLYICRICVFVQKYFMCPCTDKENTET